MTDLRPRVRGFGTGLARAHSDVSEHVAVPMKLSLGSVQETIARDGFGLLTGLPFSLRYRSNSTCWSAVVMLLIFSFTARVSSMEMDLGAFQGVFSNAQQTGEVFQIPTDRGFHRCSCFWCSLVSVTFQPVVFVVHRFSTICPFAPGFVFLVCWAPSLGVLEDMLLYLVYVGSQMYLGEILKVRILEVQPPSTLFRVSNSVQHALRTIYNIRSSSNCLET